jgi:hypothetical protein
MRDIDRITGRVEANPWPHVRVNDLALGSHVSHSSPLFTTSFQHHQFDPGNGAMSFTFHLSVQATPMSNEEPKSYANGTSIIPPIGAHKATIIFLHVRPNLLVYLKRSEANRGSANLSVCHYVPLLVGRDECITEI